MLIRLLLSLSLAIAVFAQYTTGRIEGNISDPSGAPVNSAKLVLTNFESNQTRKTTSLYTGVFFFAALNPGSYRLQVS